MACMIPAPSRTAPVRSGSRQESQSYPCEAACERWWKRVPGTFELALPAFGQERHRLLTERQKTVRPVAAQPMRLKQLLLSRLDCSLKFHDSSHTAGGKISVLAAPPLAPGPGSGADSHRPSPAGSGARTVSQDRLHLADGAYLLAPRSPARNTSWFGNLPNNSDGCAKLVASTSAGLPAIHCDKSIAS